MTSGTIAVEVAWSTRLTGVITVGTYQVGNTDVVGGTWGQNAFDDISTDVYSIPLIERGRTEPFGPMSMGRAQIVLNDSTAKYNPENSASSLYGYLLPFRPVRIRETYGGVTYGLFNGFIEEIRHDPDARKSYINCVDFFERLAGTKPTIASMGATNVGAAIGAVLDARGWTAAEWRSLDDGHSIPDFSASADKDGTELITDVLAADLGTFFVDGDGLTTYHSLSRRYKRQAVVATWDGTMITAAQPATTVRRIVNKQTVTRSGGAAQSYTDTDSERQYDTREGAAITSAYLNTDAQALDCAEWIVLTRKDPRPPAREVSMIAADETRLLQILAREVGDYVTATVDREGTTLSGWIEGLRIVIEPGLIHRASYTLGKKTVNMWTVGQSQVGSADLVGY